MGKTSEAENTSEWNKRRSFGPYCNGRQVEPPTLSRAQALGISLVGPLLAECLHITFNEQFSSSKTRSYK